MINVTVSSSTWKCFIYGLRAFQLSWYHLMRTDFLRLAFRLTLIWTCCPIILAISRSGGCFTLTPKHSSSVSHASDLFNTFWLDYNYNMNINSIVIHLFNENGKLFISNDNIFQFIPRCWYFFILFLMKSLKLIRKN